MTREPAPPGPPADDGRVAALATAVASCGLVLAALPAFLVGGLAVQIRADLGFSEAVLGAAVSGAFVASACAAPFTGRLADRIGARAAVLTGSALTALALGGIAGGATAWAHIAALLTLSGVALAITDPGLAVMVSRAVPANRQGAAFGVKEASIPLATLVAGLAVPAIALTLGWRWAFLLGAVPLAGLVVLLPRVSVPPQTPASPALDATTPQDPAPPPPSAPDLDAPSASPPRADRPTPGAPRRLLVLVSVGAALGLGAASGVGVFVTQSAVAMGLAPGTAGMLLAAGSVAGIVTRITAGVVADRRRGEQLGVISWMLAGGAAGMALGALGTGPLLVVGTLAAFAGGWGWSGLLFLSLVRASPDAPGSAAGIGVAGLATGNALGPTLFGVVSQSWSFAAAWAVAAAAAAVAAVLVRVARSRLLSAERAASSLDSR